MGTRADRRVLEGRATLDRLLDEQPPVDLRVRQVTDLAELGRELSGLSLRTRREVLSLHAGAMPTEPMLQHAARADQELLDRGVHVRVLYPSSFAQVGFIRDFVDQQTAAGAMYRFADAIPYRMIISDGLRAVVPHVATSERSGAILTSEAVLVRALRHLAISMLRRGSDLEQLRQAGGRTAPTEMELKVIRALSLGLTDEAAAKRLAVSERTFRRHVASVMERLDAVSRFQAGVRAVERGWM
ncbi:helix-turn-helix transcriptional regulator [Cumulibacter manganitolerans]|uniref:helix-turn-helix transcriptional regulator n=1 Tax=Cumulibacter manganitolerans TaxID=1884992 RepID=UPI001885CF3B|nr:helix-turn-helix transcriptional regulator [Cumulibacter manganitolerans]